MRHGILEQRNHHQVGQLCGSEVSRGNFVDHTLSAEVVQDGFKDTFFQAGCILKVCKANWFFGGDESCKDLVFLRNSGGNQWQRLR